MYSLDKQLQQILKTNISQFTLPIQSLSVDKPFKYKTGNQSPATRD
jgi:hypothetical protein